MTCWTVHVNSYAVDELEDAVPRCPRWLVLMDIEGTVDLPYAECPVRNDVLL